MLKDSGNLFLSNKDIALHISMLLPWIEQTCFGDFYFNSLLMKADLFIHNKSL